MSLPKLRTIIVGYFLIFLAINIGQTAITTYEEYQKVRAGTPDLFLEPGHAFADLPPLLADQRAIGYLTDLDFSSESLDTESFLSAQYKLAPIVLDVNNKDHKLILIDASNLSNAFPIMEGIPAAPVHYNFYGKLLAQRP